MQPSVLVPVADGTEELEAVAIIDVLRRAGAAVTVASVMPRQQITAARGVVIVADTLIGDCVDLDFDLVALPGGIPGAEHLRDSDELAGILKRQVEKRHLMGAVCASPAVVLAHHGLLADRQATCHPAFMERLTCARRLEDRVVVDGNVVTSRGAGTAVEFALALVEQLYGKTRRDAVAGPMVA
jgi:protein deglycase